MPRPISDAAIKAMLTREEALFTQRNSNSKRHSEAAAKHWLRR